MSFYGREFEWETQGFENTKYIVNFGGNPMEAYQGGLYMMHRIQKAREFAAAAPAATTMSNRGSAKHYNGVQADRAIRTLDVLVGSVGKPGGLCLSSLRGWAGRYGQDGLPKLSQPGPKPSNPKPWGIGEGYNEEAFKKLPQDIQDRVAGFPEMWKKKYFGELATPSEFPLSWHWYSMRVGQLVYPYTAGGKQKVSAYMSFTLGSSYGYPEATSLERWDHHSTNNYGLVPYTGLRQPLVPPAGETKSIQHILRDLAQKIGGGMEEYFAFEDMEEFYKEWYKNLPISWEEFKRRGIWYDESREKDYELYNRPINPELLADSTTDEKTGIITNNASGKPIGININGKPVHGFETPSRKIGVYDDIWPIAAKAVGLDMNDVNALPINPCPLVGGQNWYDNVCTVEKVTT